MAQFGKHLFGSSYFGQTSTFNGTYETEIIDADDLFTGRVRVELNGDLPIATYKGNDLQLSLGEGVYVSGESAKADAAGGQIKALICGSTFAIDAVGEATVTFKHIETGTEDTQVFTDTLSIEKDYADYLITLTTTSASFELKALTARVANVGIEVRSADTLADTLNFIPDWDAYSDVILSYNVETDRWEGETPELTSTRFVQLKLHLSTSESTLSPVINGLHFSSGDLNKHADRGQWYCSLNMKNIANDQDRTFQRVKRVNWVEDKQPNSSLTLRSASIAGSHAGHPSRSNIEETSYWQAESAPYILKDGTGTPWSRLSLAEQGNGFDASSMNSDVLIGPINPARANLSNTTLVSWLNWNEQSDYPTNRHGVEIVYELYKNRDDIAQGYAPIFRAINPKDLNDRFITLADEDQTESVYLRINLKRIAGKGSPVVDYIDLNAQMHYEAPYHTGQYTETLSPLDGIDSPTADGKGRKELRTVASTIFDWPGLNQPLSLNNANLLDNPRNVRVVYRPKYLNQVAIGYSEGLEEEDSFKADTTKEWTFYARTTANSPVASTVSVSPDRLVWHASYDGGTVNYPLVSERDLSSAFTPRLLEGKRYRFHLVNGWKNETFKLPVSMTWAEIEDVTGHSQAAIEDTNGTIKSYGGKVPMGYTLTLPNTSLNSKVVYAFKSNGTRLTEQSLWNGENNDTIEAKIPDGGEYTYREWVSDEVMFEGIINANDRLLPYVRTQSSVMNARRDTTHEVEADDTTAADLGKRFNVNPNDIRVRNENREVFHSGDTVIIPGTFSLPSLEPGLIYDGENPYVIEIVPGSVHKTADRQFLPESTVQAGSDDEPAIQYSLVDSPAMSATIERGSIQNGGDLIPFTDVRSVLRVQDENGVTYIPYSNSGGTEMGDYILKDNRIDWSPTHSNAKEPATGTTYTVTVIHGIVNTLRLVYTSDYTEKMANDRLWRSRESIELNGVVTPEEDFIGVLPPKHHFAGWHSGLMRTAYVVEDNDTWVQTSIDTSGDEPVLFATLNGEDPSRNWYPEIQTGFYYIGDTEYYLYSEPRKHRFEEKDVPIINGVTYTQEGMKLNTAT